MELADDCLYLCEVLKEREAQRKAWVHEVAVADCVAVDKAASASLGGPAEGQ